MEKQIKEKIIEDIKSKRIINGTGLELILVEDSGINISGLHNYMETTPLQPLSTLSISIGKEDSRGYGSEEMSKIIGYFHSYDDKHDRNYFKMSWGTPRNIENVEYPSFNLEVPFENISSYMILS